MLSWFELINNDKISIALVLWASWNQLFNVAWNNFADDQKIWWYRALLLISFNNVSQNTYIKWYNIEQYLVTG